MNAIVKRFLLDTNILITPYQNYYPFDMASHYWRQISGHIKSGNIIILDKVFIEAQKGEDELSEWMKNEIPEQYSHRSPDVIKSYRSVLDYIQTCGLYKECALRKWADNETADAWLIATAMVSELCIVTLEARSGGLSKSFPSKEAKIPDVCDHFRVETISLFEMMRRLKISLS
jgi:hypothetical protein